MIDNQPDKLESLKLAMPNSIVTLKGLLLKPEVVALRPSKGIMIEAWLSKLAKLNNLPTHNKKIESTTYETVRGRWGRTKQVPKTVTINKDTHIPSMLWSHYSGATFDEKKLLDDILVKAYGNDWKLPKPTVVTFGAKLIVPGDTVAVAQWSHWQKPEPASYYASDTTLTKEYLVTDLPTPNPSFSEVEAINNCGFEVFYIKTQINTAVFAPTTQEPISVDAALEEYVSE